LTFKRHFILYVTVSEIPLEIGLMLQGILLIKLQHQFWQGRNETTLPTTDLFRFRNYMKSQMR